VKLPSERAAGLIKVLLCRALILKAGVCSEPDRHWYRVVLPSILESLWLAPGISVALSFDFRVFFRGDGTGSWDLPSRSLGLTTLLFAEVAGRSVLPYNKSGVRHD